MIKRSRDMRRVRRTLPAGSWWRSAVVIVVPDLVTGTVAALVFFRVLDTATSTDRLELIRTTLAVAAGTGAVMPLVLAWRRQRATEYDATERRLTELYVKPWSNSARIKPQSAKAIRSPASPRRWSAPRSATATVVRHP